MKYFMNCTCCIVVLLFVFTASAYAQEEQIGPESGDFSLSPTLSFSSTSYDEGASSQTLLIQTGFGYYFTKNIEFGGLVLAAGSGESWSDSSMTGIFPFLTYHFLFSDDQRFSPFVGIEVGSMKIESDDYSDNYTSGGAFVGFDYYLSKKVSIRTKLDVTQPIGGDFKFTQKQLTVGFNILF